MRSYQLLLAVILGVLFMAAVQPPAAPRGAPSNAGRASPAPALVSSEQDCQRGQEIRTSELCAQWKAADAAADAAWWAAFSSWLGGLSFLGIIGALGIAYHANRIARQSMEAQVRAWVAIDFLEALRFRMENGRPRFLFRAAFENVGSTPAINFRYFAALAFGDDPRSHIDETIKQFATGKIDWIEANLFPHRPLERRVSCDHDGDPPTITETHLYVAASYRTAFSKKERYTIVLFLIHDNRRDDRLIDFRSPPFGDHIQIGSPDKFVGYAT